MKRPGRSLMNSKCNARLPSVEMAQIELIKCDLEFSQMWRSLNYITTKFLSQGWCMPNMKALAPILQKIWPRSKITDYKIWTCTKWKIVPLILQSTDKTYLQLLIVQLWWGWDQPWAWWWETGLVGLEGIRRCSWCKAKPQWLLIFTTMIIDKHDDQKIL